MNLVDLSSFRSGLFVLDDITACEGGGPASSTAFVDENTLCSSVIRSYVTQTTFLSSTLDSALKEQMNILAPRLNNYAMYLSVSGRGAAWVEHQANPLSTPSLYAELN